MQSDSRVTNNYPQSGPQLVQGMITSIFLYQTKFLQNYIQNQKLTLIFYYLEKYYYYST